jgi:hypothetical protein
VERNDFAGNVLGTALKAVRLAWAWLVCFVTVRACRFKLYNAKKDLDSRTATLGMEFYALYRRGDSEILKSVVILQQLKIVEEAEARVLALQERVDAVGEQYRQKKDAILVKPV